CLGYYSLLAAALVGPGGAVHAFEPAPPLLPLLRRNLSGKPNIRIVDRAVSRAAGSAQFHVSPLPFVGNSSLRADWQKRKTERMTVETVSLDDYCRSVGVFPDVVKLDVEGVEDDVLRGAGRLLRERAPLLVLEVFAPLLESDREAFRILREFGYAPHAIEKDGRLRALSAESVDSYLASLKERYRRIQDSPNDFDNLVFKRA
ncbi:MAG: FkbM family methyltransferase, partial [Elusimicrobia bacterium]|nr:FkbM family methyltransferase [Elusimicrobiota bacterium]